MPASAADADERFAQPSARRRPAPAAVEPDAEAAQALQTNFPQSVLLPQLTPNEFHDLLPTLAGANYQAVVFAGRPPAQAVNLGLRGDFAGRRRQDTVAVLEHLGQLAAIARAA